MSQKTPMELHHEFFERRRREAVEHQRLCSHRHKKRITVEAAFGSYVAQQCVECGKVIDR